MSKGILGKSDQELFKYLLTKKTSLKIEITHPIFIKIIV